MRTAWCRFLPAFILFQLCITKGLLAVDSPVTTYLGIEQGLSNNSVRCLYQDKKGFMWFGTYDGLNRYDGYEFKIFRNNFKNPGSVVNNWINAINEDDHGNIWVGTRQGAGVYRILKDSFSPLYYRESKTKTTKLTSVIKCIERDASGNMFVGTNNLGLLFFVKGDSVATQLLLASESSNYSYEVYAMAKGVGNKIWVTVRGKGLFVSTTG